MAKLNKTHLVDKLLSHGLTRNREEASLAISIILSEITSAVHNNGIGIVCVLQDFGSFEVYERPARDIKLFGAKEKTHVPARRMVRFIPSKTLKKQAL